MSRKTERRQKKKCKGNKLSMDKVLMKEAREFFKIYNHDKTRNSYEKNYKKYIDYCRQKHNAKSKADVNFIFRNTPTVLPSKVNRQAQYTHILRLFVFIME